MFKNYDQSEKNTHKIAIAALYFGIGSLVALLVSIVIGFLVESIGIISFFGIVSVLALAAIVCGIKARKKIATEKLQGKSVANIGITLGGIALLIMILLRITIFLFFIPWLGA